MILFVVLEAIDLHGSADFCQGLASFGFGSSRAFFQVNQSD